MRASERPASETLKKNRFPSFDHQMLSGERFEASMIIRCKVIGNVKPMVEELLVAPSLLAHESDLLFDEAMRKDSRSALELFFCSDFAMVRLVIIDLDG